MFRTFASRIARHTASVLLSTACMASMFVVANAANAQGLYQPPAPNLATGTTPQGVASADFARSGFQSLVVTDNASNNMKVYLATGAGTFASAFTYATCTKPTAVLAQDVNQDGYPDIVVACPTVNLVDLFVNDGTGHFGGAAAFSASDPVALVAGDFLDNGTVGVAAAKGTGGITVFLNVGGSVVTKTVAASGTFTGIVTADLNHDGHLDLAVSDSANNNVHVFTGDGAGNFTAAGNYSTGAGTQPSGIATADFNHDGNSDVATSNAGNNTATILLGSSSGTLTAQTAQAAGANPIAIVATDVNSDGNSDVVAFDSITANTGAIAVLLGNGDGTLQTAQSISLSSKPGTVAAVADFNRDGKPDLALTRQSSNLVSVLLNNTLPTPYPGGRSYAAYSTQTAGNGNMADGIASGDFNRDGRLDVAVTYLEDDAVRVLMNNGSGFGTAATYAVGSQPYSVTSGDVNGDGYPDLVVVNSTVNGPTGSVSVLLNNGNGTFAPAVNYSVGRLPYQVAIGDLNGDGYPDLAVTNYGANTVSILYGSSAGTFTTGPTLPTGVNPYGVVIGDFQHNGHPDVAVTCFTPDMLYVFPNNGNGTFGSPFMDSTGSGPMSLVTGDFNRDGKLDIVVANATGGPAGDTDPVTSGNNISFFAGNGDGTFQPGVIGPSLNFPQSIAAGDVNGDGILDIVGVAPNFNSVIVTLGVGDGTFGTIQQRAQGQFTAVKQPWALVLGDFNNDGKLDIVTANTFNPVNITIPAYQNRYMTQYPAVPGGHPSVDLLLNQSAADVSLAISPTPPLPANNTGATITATVQPALSGPTPTGSVLFEDNTGTPVGSGPYTLDSGGTASYDTGHLGSGQYLFTTLYSGDKNFQPTTASGAAFAVTVAGTPVTLTISPSSVPYGGSFTASVTVTGTPGFGRPTGTLTIYSTTGFVLGTVTLTNSGANNTAGTRTFTALAPNLVAGSYNFYAVYAPSNGNYQQGSSSNAPLTVTAATTTLTDICGNIVLASGCIATVHPASGPAINGGVVNFTVSFNGGPANAPVSEPVNTNNAVFPNAFSASGSYFVLATFVPANGNYLGSSTSNTFTITCFFPGFCIGGNARRSPLTTLNSFTGLNLNQNGARRNRNRDVPFSLF